MRGLIELHPESATFGWRDVTKKASFRFIGFFI